MNRTNRLIAALALASSTLAGTAVMADQHKMGDHKKMAPTKNIFETASATPDLSTLVAAVKAARLVDTLTRHGPFTVFAPTNAAFEKLPAGTVETLMDPENRDALIKILTYHMVAGKLTSTDIVAAIKAGGGNASLTTWAGEKLTARLSGSSVVITDSKGGQSTVTTVDVMQTNGVVHIIDWVLIPNL
jgi:uncharacterized surface protein with fasciclin (FAS1) repeats